jgi:outer membrane protein OmpA-like peptidoglycan-associated protein
MLAVLALAASPAIACPQYDTVVAAVQTGDQAGAEALYEEIVFSAACDDAIREWVGDYLARENFLAALQEADPARKQALLETALGFERHWRSHAELGRVHWGEKRYADAAREFQLALNELSEGDQSHAAEPDEIAEVYQLATAALALSERPVDMPRTRSGKTGGIFTMSFRGFTVEEVSLPITFEFDSTDFDGVGHEYAQRLVDHVRLIAPRSIKLGGHTDPMGSDTYNLSLSEARAQRVRDLLIESGFEGEIIVAGYGESDIPPAPPGIEPGSDEHNRIARRVAFSTQ